MLAKEVFSVSHDIFAEAVNRSEILPNFCSLDSDDAMFGSCASWIDQESKVKGRAGDPPFTN